MTFIWIIFVKLPLFINLLFRVMSNCYLIFFKPTRFFIHVNTINIIVIYTIYEGKTLVN